MLVDAFVFTWLNYLMLSLVLAHVLASLVKTRFPGFFFPLDNISNNSRFIQEKRASSLKVNLLPYFVFCLMSVFSLNKILELFGKDFFSTQ